SSPTSPLVYPLSAASRKPSAFLNNVPYFSSHDTLRETQTGLRGSVMRHRMIFIALVLAGCGGSDSPTSIGASLAPKVEQSTGWTFQSEPVFEVIDRPALLKKFEAKLQGEG